jgi:hypothetical protein
MTTTHGAPTQPSPHANVVPEQTASWDRCSGCVFVHIRVLWHVSWQHRVKHACPVTHAFGVVMHVPAVTLCWHSQQSSCIRMQEQQQCHRSKPTSWHSRERHTAANSCSSSSCTEWRVQLSTRTAATVQPTLSVMRDAAILYHQRAAGTAHTGVVIQLCAYQDRAML